jgi:Xaa-Pro aminopeptidase
MAGRSPVQNAKAVKNEVEQEGMRQCHIRDGTALVEYFAWLENELLNGNKLDEVEAADKLEQIRRYLRSPLFLTVVKRIYLLDYHSIQSVLLVQMER